MWWVWKVFHLIKQEPCLFKLYALSLRDLMSWKTLMME